MEHTYYILLNSNSLINNRCSWEDNNTEGQLKPENQDTHFKKPVISEVYQLVLNYYEYFSQSIANPVFANQLLKLKKKF